MTNNKLYENVCTMIYRHFDSATYGNLADKLVENPHNYLDIYDDFGKCAASILDDIQRSSISRAGNKTNAINRLLKRAEQRMLYYKFPFSYDDKTYTAITDGYTAMAFTEDIDFLPVGNIKIDTLFSRVSKCGDELTLPTLAELKDYIKREKTKKKISKDRTPVCIELEDCYVNAEYLKDILEAIPNAKAIKPEVKLGVIFFTNGNDIAILCQVRKG